MSTTRNRVLGITAATALGLGLFAPVASAAPGASFVKASAGQYLLAADSPAAFSVADAYQLATGNAKLEITAASGTTPFGTEAEFKAGKWTATATPAGASNSQKLTLTYVSSSKVRVALPAGTGGTASTIDLLKDAESQGTLEVTYEAKVNSVSWKVDTTDGTRVGTISGTGLSQIDGVSLTTQVAGDSASAVTLSAVADAATLATSTSGYVVVKDSQVLVKLPAGVTGKEGTWRVSLTPKAGVRFTTLSPATKLDVKYVAPKITKLSAAGFSTAAAGEITLTGSNLGVLGESGNGVYLRPAAAVDATGDIAVTVKSGSLKQTQAVLTTPVKADVAALTAGEYRVVLKTGFGFSADSGKATDKLLAVTPGAVTAASSAVLGGGGKVNLDIAGINLGATAKEFSAKKVTATTSVTVGAKTTSKTVTLKYVDADTVEATLPAGTPGQTAPITIYQQGVAFSPVNVNYAAGITSISKTVLTTAGGDVKLSGVGLSGTFKLHKVADGASTTNDITVTPASEKLDAKGKSATITVPNTVTEGVYQVVVTPSGDFSGATQLFTSKSVISISNNG